MSAIRDQHRVTKAKGHSRLSRLLLNPRTAYLVVVLHSGARSQKRGQVVIRNSAWIIFHTKIQGVCIYAIIAPCKPHRAALLSDAEQRGAARRFSSSGNFPFIFPTPWLMNRAQRRSFADEHTTVHKHTYYS